VENNGVY